MRDGKSRQSLPRHLRYMLIQPRRALLPRVGHAPTSSRAVSCRLQACDLPLKSMREHRHKSQQATSSLRACLLTFEVYR
jgi:hypothetical protein